MQHKIGKIPQTKGSEPPNRALHTLEVLCWVPDMRKTLAKVAHPPSKATSEFPKVRGPDLEPAVVGLSLQGHRQKPAIGLFANPSPCQMLTRTLVLHDSHQDLLFSCRSFLQPLLLMIEILHHSVCITYSNFYHSC